MSNTPYNYSSHPFWQIAFKNVALLVFYITSTVLITTTEIYGQAPVSLLLELGQGGVLRDGVDPFVVYARFIPTLALTREGSFSAGLSLATAYTNPGWSP